MFLMRFLWRWIDPDRLIPAKSWWIIGVLSTLTALLFAATVLLVNYSDQSMRLTNATRDHFIRLDNLEKAMNSIDTTLRQYEQHLYAFMLNGLPADLAAAQQNQQEMALDRASLDKLIHVGTQSDLVQLNSLLDTVFDSGARATGFWYQGQREKALSEMERLKLLNLDKQILHHSDHIFRIQVDSLNQQIKTDASVTSTTFHDLLFLLSSLAGVIFILLTYAMGRTARRVMKDRREYRQIYSEQKKAAAFTQNLINILPIGYHSVDANGIILEMNQTELDWLGYTREEIIGKKPIVELYHNKTYQARFTEIFNQFKKTGEAKNIELSLTSKDGRAIPILFNSKAVYDCDGNFTHSISTVYNFTERKKLEVELVAARQEAENAKRLKQLFMANMSHEIRTPLNAILGFSNLLVSARIDPELKEYVQSIQISSINLLSIVNDILDFEKIQSGMLRMEQIEFDLPGLLHSVITMLRSGAVNKGLTLELQTDAELPLMLVGDPLRLTQVLINLIGNAIKFTDHGSVVLRVNTLVRTGSEAVTIQFEVEDTGIGIPVSEQNRIFQRFIQARSDTMRIYGGTGLGLAIVKLIVDLQQGVISLRSTEGKGSVFTVEIPFQMAMNVILPDISLPAEENTYPDFRGYHILLVEDNPMNRRIAEINLLKCGLKVTQAQDGQEAIELLRNNPDAYDLVFMDIQMPVIDGYSATKIIRSELVLTDLPIIAVTAHVLSGEREKVLACGMNDYLTKPVKLEEVSTVLLRHLGHFWDQQTFYDQVHGKEENLQEIIGLFNRQFPKECISLQKALESNDFKEVSNIAHSMCSTVGYTGFNTVLGSLLRQIEAAAKLEKPVISALNQLYSSLVMNGRHAMALLQREALKTTINIIHPPVPQYRTIGRF